MNFQVSPIQNLSRVNFPNLIHVHPKFSVNKVMENLWSHFLDNLHSLCLPRRGEGCDCLSNTFLFDLLSHCLPRLINLLSLCLPMLGEGCDCPSNTFLFDLPVLSHCLPRLINLLSLCLPMLGEGCDCPSNTCYTDTGPLDSWKHQKIKLSIRTLPLITPNFTKKLNFHILIVSNQIKSNNFYLKSG
jgi:hypothetical protein